MRTLLFLAAVLTSSGAACAQTRPAHPGRAAGHPVGNAAKSIGKFDDWQAATHAEAGQPVCYAFTRAQPGSSPGLPGRGDVVMTVTQRPSGRDAVAITAGFAYVAGAEAVMQVDKAELPFYTSGRSAFARDGHAVVAAFDRGRVAALRSPGPKGGSVTDSFSLRGFGAAYAAINKACPGR